MALQYVVVYFEETRDVLVDGDANGQTEQTIRVGEGHHDFSLSGEKNYSPALIPKLVSGTTSIEPLELTFHRLQDDQHD